MFKELKGIFEQKFLFEDYGQESKDGFLQKVHESSETKCKTSWHLHRLGLSGLQVAETELILAYSKRNLNKLSTGGNLATLGTGGTRAWDRAKFLPPSSGCFSLRWALLTFTQLTSLSETQWGARTQTMTSRIVERK